MEGLYNEHVNMSGSGGPAGAFGGGAPIFLGAGSHGFGGFGGNGDFLSLIIGLKALDNFGFNDKHGHRDRDRDLLTRDDLIHQGIGDLKGAVKDNKGDIISAIKDNRSDVREAITALNSNLTGEFRDLFGKLCDFRHDSVLQALQTRVDLKDAKCDIEKQIDKKGDSIQASIRDLRDDLNDRFTKLREGQLKEIIDDLRRDKEALTRRVQKDDIVDAIFDRLAHDRDRDRRRRRDHDDCDIPFAAVPGTVMAPLIATAVSDPCNGSGLAKTK